MGADTFAYDGVSRLVAGTAMQGQVSETSAYDPFGNRVSAETPTVGFRAIPVDPETNRLLSKPSRAVDYDSRGNQTLTGTTSYSYDAFDQIVRQTDSETAADLSYVYTADDERMVTIDNPTPSETWVLRDLGGLVLRRFFRLLGDTEWKKDIVHRQGAVLASDDAGLGVHHAHLDHLGTIRKWTRPDKTVRSSHTYSAFGEEIAEGLTQVEENQFTGHERDRNRTGGCSGTETVDGQTLSTGQTITGCDEVSSSNTTVTSTEEVRFVAGEVVSLGEGFTVADGGVFAAELDGLLNSDLQDLDYMHARYCSPVEGRFLSLDSLGGQPHQPQTWNRLSYVTNDPLKWVDPTGQARVRATTTSLGTTFEVQFETSRVEIVGRFIAESRFLPRKLRRLRRPIDAGRAIDEFFRGEFVETSSGTREKLRLAAFEREVRALFVDQVGEGLAGVQGLYSEKQLRKLGEVVRQVADRLVRDGKITQEERDRIVVKYDVETLIHEAKRRERGSLEDEQDEREPE